jgi:hypothetical protein
LKASMPVNSKVSPPPQPVCRSGRSSFNARFGITESNEERFRQFKNRTLDTVDRILGEKILSSRQLEREYLHFLGKPCPTTTTGPAFKNAMAVFSGADFAQSVIYRSLDQENSLVEYCHCLDAFFHLRLPQTDLQALFDGFASDLKLSSIPVRMARYGEHYGFYQARLRVLDERVVDADLTWLCDYPKALTAFENALAQSSDPAKQREMLDSSRISLENLVRQLLGNRRNLENNKEALLKWMDNHGTNTETRQMMRQLFQFYCEYQNNHVKHGDGWKPAEVNFTFYLTATFIHLLLGLVKQDTA